MSDKIKILVFGLRDEAPASGGFLPLISIEDSQFFHGGISGEQIYAAAKEFVK